MCAYRDGTVTGSAVLEREQESSTIPTSELSEGGEGRTEAIEVAGRVGCTAPSPSRQVVAAAPKSCPDFSSESNYSGIFVS